MAIGFWSKLKAGFKRFAKGVKNVWNKIKPVVGKLVSAAQVVAPAIADKIRPGAGAVISGGLGVANQFLNGQYTGALKQGAGLAGIQLGDLANVKLRGGGG
jgi:hypothetical protein